MAKRRFLAAAKPTVRDRTLRCIRPQIAQFCELLNLNYDGMRSLLCKSLAQDILNNLSKINRASEKQTYVVGIRPEYLPIFIKISEAPDVIKFLEKNPNNLDILVNEISAVLDSEDAITLSEIIKDTLNDCLNAIFSFFVLHVLNNARPVNFYKRSKPSSYLLDQVVCLKIEEIGAKMQKVFYKLHPLDVQTHIHNALSFLMRDPSIVGDQREVELAEGKFFITAAGIAILAEITDYLRDALGSNILPTASSPTATLH